MPLAQTFIDILEPARNWRVSNLVSKEKKIIFNLSSNSDAQPVRILITDDKGLDDFRQSREITALYHSFFPGKDTVSAIVYLPFSMTGSWHLMVINESQKHFPMVCMYGVE